MTVLIFAFLVLLVAALIIYALQRTPVIAPFNWILEVLVILIAAAIIASKAGLT